MLVLSMTQKGSVFFFFGESETMIDFILNFIENLNDSFLAFWVKLSSRHEVNRSWDDIKREMNIPD